MEMLVTPKAATANVVPGGPKVEMARGRAVARDEDGHKRTASMRKSPAGKRAKAMLQDPEGHENSGGAATGSGGGVRVSGDPPEAAAPTQMDIEEDVTTEQWRKREAAVLRQHELEGTDAKKAGSLVQPHRG